jgi:N utilization substance protein A
MISYRTETYGPLPAEVAGETVDLRAADGKLNIYYADRLIASYIIDERL